MEKVTFILPIHTGTDEAKKYLRNCLQSVVSLNGIKTPNIIVSTNQKTSAEIQDVLADFDDTADFTFVMDENTEFCNLVNKAADKCTTEFFSVIEFDDEYTENWYVNFLKYSAENEASVYMPIITLHNTKEDMSFLGFVNEMAWASSFAEEMGYIDRGALLTYVDFNVTGAFIKTEDFKKCGGLDPQYIIASWYAMLLKMTELEMKIYVVPKCGYKHAVMRDGSFTEELIKDKERAGKIPSIIQSLKEEYGENNTEA